MELLPVGAVAQLAHHYQVVSAFALADLLTRSGDFGTQVDFMFLQRKCFVDSFLTSTVGFLTFYLRENQSVFGILQYDTRIVHTHYHQSGTFAFVLGNGGRTSASR